MVNSDFLRMSCDLCSDWLDLCEWNDLGFAWIASQTNGILFWGVLKGALWRPLNPQNASNKNPKQKQQLSGYPSLAASNRSRSPAQSGDRSSTVEAEEAKMKPWDVPIL